MSGYAIQLHDKVLFPAWHPTTGFVSRVISIEGDIALCMPLTGGPNFEARLSDLKPNLTEGS